MLILWASLVSLFCQLPTRKGGKAIAQCSWATLHCPKSLLPAHFCLLCLGGAEELLRFPYLPRRQCFQRATWEAVGHKVDPSLLSSCLKISDPKLHDDLIFFRIFFFNEDGDGLTASRTVSCLKLAHFTRNLAIQKHFNMVFRQKKHIFLSFFLIQLRGEVHQIKCIHTKAPYLLTHFFKKA